MIIKLHKLSKQLGNKIIEFKDGRINGYNIISYRDYKPFEVIQEVSIVRPDRVISFDGAYDLLYGKPGKPDFSKVLNTRS